MWSAAAMATADCGRWIRHASSELHATSANGTPRYLCGCWWTTGILSRISTPSHQHAPLFSVSLSIIFNSFIIICFSSTSHLHPLSLLSLLSFILMARALGHPLLSVTLLLSKLLANTSAVRYLSLGSQLPIFSDT